MKKNILVIVLIALCFLLNTNGFIFADDSVTTDSTSDNIIDRIGVKGPLEFNKTSFTLAWTAKPNDTYYAQEYLPDGDNLETFNQMLAIHLFIKDLKPDDAAFEKAIELTKRKKTDPICNYALVSNADKKVFILDFLVGEIMDKRYTLVEFNVYRYQQIDLSNNKKALMVYTYCKRSYGANITPFLKTLKDTRNDYINQMTSAEIPVVTIENN
jgi:hypothetical protein